MIKLGIDQGIANTGVAINKDNKKIIDVFDIKTSSKDPLGKRLKFIYEKIKEILEIYKIDQINTERLSSYSCREGDIMKVSMVTGIIFLLGEEFRIKTVQISPKSVKKQIVGNGNAKKEDVLNWVNKSGLWVFDKKTDNHKADAIIISLAKETNY